MVLPSTRFLVLSDFLFFRQVTGDAAPRDIQGARPQRASGLTRTFCATTYKYTCTGANPYGSSTGANENVEDEKL